MNYFREALSGAFWFVAPCAIATILLALLISWLCYWLRTTEEKNKAAIDDFVSFSAIARLTVAFALFGYTLGTFAGMAGQALATTIIGTVSTTAATYLAYLYAKDTPANSRLTLASALSAFFIAVPLAVQYVTHYASTTPSP